MPGWRLSGCAVSTFCFWGTWGSTPTSRTVCRNSFNEWPRSRPGGSTMSQRDDRQFLKLYQTYRYDDQYTWYKGRQEEFTQAQTQGITLSTGLIFLAGIASVLE